MPLNPGDTCTGNTRNCSLRRGGCGYRYKKTDKKWQEGGVCPNCGLPRRCTNPPVDQMTVCWMHGAGSPKRGTMPVAYKDRVKTFLPKRMAQTYEEAITDPKLREYDSDLALLKSIQIDLEQRLDSGESGKAWKEIGEELPAFVKALKGLWTDYLVAQQNAHRNPTEQTQKELQHVMTTLNAFIKGDRPDYLMSIIRRGKTDWAIFDELRTTVELTGKTKERDLRRTKDLKAMVALESFIKFAESFAVIVDKRIDDPNLKTLIGMDVQQLFNYEGFTVDLAQAEYKALRTGDDQIQE
jgi:hypothetical protein